MGIISDNRKAIAAGLSTLAATVLVAAPDGVTGNEWIVVAATSLGAFAAVWATAENTRAATDEQPVAVPQKDAAGQRIE